MSILQNVNYMKNFVYHPCATPNPLMLIETAFEAGLPEMLELLSADFFDKTLRATKDMWRRGAAADAAKKGPPGLATQPPGGHGRRLGGTVGRRSVGIPYGAKTWVFELVDAEQTAMFWWLVADLATEFLARWTTLIYLKQRCPFDHSCFAEGQFTTIYIDQGSNSPLLPVMGTGVVISGGLEIQVIKPGPYSISYQAEIRQFGTGQPASNARVELQDSVGNRVYSNGSGGGVGDTGARLSGGFYNFPSAGTATPSYKLVLINDSPTETVAVTEGHLQLSSGLCDNAAPMIPWDGKNLFPDPR